jgi:type VI secretion system secreted protein Hcp
MTEAIIGFVRTSGSRTDERLRETVSLAFSKVSQEYVVQNQQGGSAGTVTASFDIKGNREC